MNSNKCMICDSSFSLKKLDEMCVDTNGKVRNALTMFQYCFNLKFPKKNRYSEFNKLCEICLTQLSVCCVFRRKSEQAHKKLYAHIIDNKMTDHKKLSSEISTNNEFQILSNVYEIPIENIKIEEIDKEDINYEDKISTQFDNVAVNQVKNEGHCAYSNTTLESKYNKHDVRLKCAFADKLNNPIKIMDIIQRKVKKKTSVNIIATDSNKDNKYFRSTKHHKVKRKTNSNIFVNDSIIDDGHYSDTVQHELKRNNTATDSNLDEEDFSDCSTNTEEILVATGYYSVNRRNQPKYDDSRPPLKKKSLCCPVCNESFVNFNLTRQHYIKHFPKGLCHVCGKTISSHWGFVTHLRTHEQETPNKYVCEPCKKVFKTQYTLRGHIKFCHNGQKAVTCYHCPQQFTGSLSRVIHMYKVHNVPCQFYHCDKCPLKFYSKPKLRNHVNHVHIRKVDFFCDLCGCGFTTKKDLREHIVFKHGDKSTHPTCEMCGKTFASRKGLKGHMKIHLNIKDYKCPYCESAFVQRPSLNWHLKKYHGSQENSQLFPV